MSVCWMRGREREGGRERVFVLDERERVCVLDERERVSERERE